MAFSMFRNKILTIFAAIFSGGFGFALIASIMTIYLPFNNLCVHIRTNKISVLRCLLFIPIFHRTLSPNDITLLNIIRSDNTGQGVNKIEHYKLQAHDKTGKSVTLAEDLDGEDVATHFRNLIKCSISYLKVAFDYSSR